MQLSGLLPLIREIPAYHDLLDEIRKQINAVSYVRKLQSQLG